MKNRNIDKDICQTLREGKLYCNVLIIIVSYQLDNNFLNLASNQNLSDGTTSL